MESVETPCFATTPPVKSEIFVLSFTSRRAAVMSTGSPEGARKGVLARAAAGAGSAVFSASGFSRVSTRSMNVTWRSFCFNVIFWERTDPEGNSTRTG